METCLSSWEDVNVLRPSSNRNLWPSCEPVPAMINQNTLANQSILDGSLQCSKYSSSQQYSGHSFRASSMKAQNACIDSVTLQAHDSSATVDNVILSSPTEQRVAEQQYHSSLLGDLGVLQLSKLERFGSIQRARSPCDFNQRKEQESYDIDGSTRCKPLGRLVMETCSGEGEAMARSSKKEVNSVLRRIIRGETTGSKGASAIKIPGPEKCRARARRGEATDVHSISERKRRIRITERMRALHKLVPDASKTNKASMLDEVIQYVSVLQTRLKRGCMRKLDPRASPSTNNSTAPFDSNSNAAAPGMQGQLGESAVVMPHVEQIDMQFLNGTAIMRNRRSSYIERVLDPLEDTLAEAERQVTRLLDRDLSAALIYLAGRGLSLVPIKSLMQVNVNNSSSSNSNNTLQ